MLSLDARRAFTGPYSDDCGAHSSSEPRSHLLNTVVARTRPQTERATDSAHRALWIGRRSVSLNARFVDSVEVPPNAGPGAGDVVLVGDTRGPAGRSRGGCKHLLAGICVHRPGASGQGRLRAGDDVHDRGPRWRRCSSSARSRLRRTSASSGGRKCRGCTPRSGARVPDATARAGSDVAPHPVSAARAGTGLAPTRASVRQEQARFRETAPRRKGDSDTPAVASQTCQPAVPRLAGTSSAGRGSV